MLASLTNTPLAASFLLPQNTWYTTAPTTASHLISQPRSLGCAVESEFATPVHARSHSLAVSPLTPVQWLRQKHLGYIHVWWRSSRDAVFLPVWGEALEREIAGEWERGKGRCCPSFMPTQSRVVIGSHLIRAGDGTGNWSLLPALTILSQRDNNQYLNIEDKMPRLCKLIWQYAS